METDPIKNNEVDSHVDNSVENEFRSGTHYGTIANFVPENFFKYHPHFELYDPTKTYQVEDHYADYGFGIKLYKTSQYHINEQKYVVIEEVLNEAELKELIPFCQCSYHQMHWLNPMKYFTCRCCVGCLDSPFYKQAVVYKSRQKKGGVVNI
jgi:hypothetical protein